MSSVFTQIIQGKLPCYKIYEDEKVIAFLALDQISLGHTLLICKDEIDHWLDVPLDLYEYLHGVSIKIGRAIQRATGSTRVGQMVMGFEVPHYHLHLIPAWQMADIDYKRAKRRSPEEMHEIQTKIYRELENIERTKINENAMR
ncbi:MAG TPA: HIT family protein [Bdellovibrio sp.]|uniref:HIT family protein n=1 Tax=Bdellovibrio sp. TaxID=28201 RepID=UPI002F1DEAD3